MSFRNFVKKYGLLDVLNNAEEYAKMAHDIADSVQKIYEKPTFLNTTKETLKIIQTSLMNDPMTASDYFWKGWDSVFPHSMSLIILDVIKDYEFRTIKTQEKSTTIRISDVEGIDFGWSMSTSKEGTDDIWCRCDEIDAARSKIEKLLWEKFRSQPLLVKKEKSKRGYNDKLRIEVDDKIPPLFSTEAQKMSDYLKRCFDSGVNRSIMYYGPPGTGKSTLVRTIAKMLNLKTLRIRVEDIVDIDNGLVHEIIDIFKPDCIIFDDVDRAGETSHLLEMMDDLKRTVPFLVATANDKSRLDDAILRPGRFDELIELKTLDKSVILYVLGEENKHLYSAVRRWPIAYIQELVTRRKFMTEEEAVKSLKEIKSRVESIKKWEPEDDEERETSEKSVLFG